MKRFLIALAILFLTAGISAAEDGLGSRLFSGDKIMLEVTASGLSGSGKPSFSAAQDADELNPGKALLLSAIIPGAGQLSIGKKLKAALFFTLEVAAWTGVIYYYNKGQDKDKEFREYADEYFHEGWYRAVEYELARNSEWGDSGAYNGTEPEWIEEDWDKKIHYLPDRGFTHEVPTTTDRHANQSDDQQYYEMIGKYVVQFGFGWDDYLGQPEFPADDPSTPWYDGVKRYSEIYMDMRYDSNKFLNYSSLAIQIAMLNHVASALDASFTVRAMKRKARAEVGFRQVKHNDNYVVAGGLNLRW